MEAFETAVQKMTVAEFRNLELDDDDRHLYELIDGEIVKRAAPAPRHQEVLAEMYDQVKAYVKSQGLGKVYFAPVDVTFDGHNSIQPDLLFIPTDRLSIVMKVGIEGVPALIVEIISPTSALRDRNTKVELYARFGVGEYWLVDTLYESIEMFTLENGRYELFSAASAVEGTLQSKTLAGLTLDVRALFHPTLSPSASPTA